MIQNCRHLFLLVHTLCNYAKESNLEGNAYREFQNFEYPLLFQRQSLLTLIFFLLNYLKNNVVIVLILKKIYKSLIACNVLL